MKFQIDTLHIICHYLPLGLVGYVFSIMAVTCCFVCFKSLGESLTTVGIVELVRFILQIIFFLAYYLS